MVWYLILEGQMDSFRTLERLIYLANLRHGVLASNLANVDTPGYRAMDLKFEQLLDDNAMALRTTNQNHIQQSGQGVVSSAGVDMSPAWLDKNNVELDIEVAKMTENSMLFEAGVSLLTAKMRMYRSALRRQ
jgi:flagellar basal-body rod protein FlgB